MTTHTLAFVNQKGGVGKTTISTNVASLLARRFAPGRVLFIDCDAQANGTSTFMGPDAAFGPKPPKGLMDVLVDDVPAASAIYRCKLKTLRQPTALTIDVLPAHVKLARAVERLIGRYGMEQQLNMALQPLRERYDFIVMDCPPSLGMITRMVLTAVSAVVVPVNPGVYSMVGIGYLRELIDEVRRHPAGNPALNILGVVPNNFSRTTLANETLHDLEEDFGPEMLLPIVPTRVQLGEAQSAFTDLYDHESTPKMPDPTANEHSVSHAILRVTQEIVRRTQAKKS